MSLKTWFSTPARPLRKLRARIHSTGQLILLLRMLAWWGLLRLLKPLLSLRQLVRLASCKGRRGKAQPAEILLVLKLFYELSQWAQAGDCLPRALVSHRFLTLAGMHPRLVIGFNAAAGHSWVVLGDKPLFESQAQLLDYRPILTLLAGDTRPVEITPLEDNFAS